MSDHSAAPLGKSRDFLQLASNAGAGNGTPKVWGGGRGVFSATATWGGGSVKLQYMLPDGTWADVGAHTTLMANGGGGFELPRCEIRAVVATATAAYAWVQGTGVS